MAIIDRQNEFCDGQAVTVSAASTDYIDLQDADRDIGPGEPIRVVAQVDTDVTAAGAATVDIAVQTDDNSSFSSPTTLIQRLAVPKATLVQGYKILDDVLPAGVERYLRVYFTVNTGPLTAGAFSAFFTLNDGSPDVWRAVADAL